jgi:hypothetical protein
MMAGLVSQNMLWCIVGGCCTGSVRCVWSIIGTLLGNTQWDYVTQDYVFQIIWATLMYQARLQQAFQK